MKQSFPWLALGLGLLIAIVLLAGGALGPADAQSLPLLTLLIIAEFGFFLTAIGAGMAIRALLQQAFSLAQATAAAGCASLAVAFLWLGIRLWPGGFPPTA